MTRVMLICTDRDTHDPVPLEVFELPLPPGWTPGGRSTVVEFPCERARGGCGRAPRPGTPTLRALLEGLAERGESVFDLSYMEI
jgi:hypothetical protein